jgi:hypothetical protein
MKFLLKPEGKTLEVRIWRGFGGSTGGGAGGGQVGYQNVQLVVLSPTMYHTWRYEFGNPFIPLS